MIGYGEWRSFENVLDKVIMVAKTVCSYAAYHFVDVNKMIALAKGASRKIKDFALSRYGSRGKLKASLTQHEVGAKVRQAIKEFGGAMPEDLPTTEKSIKQSERVIVEALQ
ncbi:MAG: hypothetical protein LE178_00005, partial [Endomicrobium sp.]|nr:hypothetical protein [Endomicrobium sp.]